VVVLVSKKRIIPSPEDRKDAEMNAGIKPIIHQSELKVVPFALLFCCIVTNTEWNGIMSSGDGIILFFCNS
jgi:hypothetical protein